ncbi:MAG: alpha/beta fold hydrolase [Thermomicrobiales bacterium]
MAALEHRGHGRTNNPSTELSYERIAEDIAGFIAQRDLALAHVAGMSDGDVATLHLAMTRPDLIGAIVGFGVNYMNAERRLLDAIPTGEPMKKPPPWTRKQSRCG